MSLLAGALLLLVRARMKPRLSLKFIMQQRVIAAVFALLTIGAVSTVVYPRGFWSVLMPLLTLLVFGLVLYTLIRRPFDLMGVIGVWQVITRKNGSLSDKVGLVAFLSLGLGMVNLLPLFPADGGRLVDNVLGQWMPQLQEDFLNVSFAFFLFFVLVTFGVDLLRIIRRKDSPL